jgi:hypothetical protein
MNIVKRIEQYQDEHVFFCEPIKNNVMNEGNFVRILYSNSLFVLNGISILIPLHDIVIEKYYNKYKCMFNANLHKDLIEKMRLIEEGLLRKYYIRNKIPQYKINEQLKNGNIRLFLENVDKITNCNFMLKISGIWETDNYYGLTYKFTKANNV